MNLTPRQTEIMRLLCRGVTDKEIACEIGISLSTVRVHVVCAMRRLKARTRPHAVAVYIDQKHYGEKATHN